MIRHFSEMETLEEVSQLSVGEVSSYLARKLDGKVDDADSVDRIISSFADNKISGMLFVTLSTEELKELIPIIGDRKVVKTLIDDLKGRNEVTTVSAYIIS